MKIKVTLVTIAVAVALAAAGCQQAPTPKPAQGPSKFLAGFSVPRIVASFQATSGGLRCPDIQPASMTVSTTTRDTSFDGWSHAELTTSCEDPGDGSALAEAWGAGVDAELARFGAVVPVLGESTSPSGRSFHDTWEYVSDGLRGHITVQVLPGPDGHYWSIVHIFEPS